MVTRVFSTACRSLRQFGGDVVSGRFVQTVSAALTGRSRIERLSGLLDDLNIALVAADWTSGNAVVNTSASAIET